MRTTRGQGGRTLAVEKNWRRNQIVGGTSYLEIVFCKHIRNSFYSATKVLVSPCLGSASKVLVPKTAHFIKRNYIRNYIINLFANSFALFEFPWNFGSSRTKAKIKTKPKEWCILYARRDGVYLLISENFY